MRKFIIDKIVLLFFFLVGCAVFMPMRAHATCGTVSPEMGLIVPGVGCTAGPTWAADLNASLATIDTHNHCSGSGVQIPPCGLNINSDLTFLGNNATDMNSVVFDTNGGSPSNLAVYSNGTDLFYVDSSGTAIQVTKNHGVNVSAGNIQGLPSTPNGNAGISWVNPQSTFQFLQDDGTKGANTDQGTAILRYPGSYPNPTGNYVALQAPSGTVGYAITAATGAPSSSGALVTMSTGGQLSYSHVDGATLTLSSGTIQVPSQGIQQANLAARATGTSVGAGGVAISSSSGAFTSASGSLVAVTNLSVTLVTTGRPVELLLQPDGSNLSSVGNNFGGGVEIDFFDGASDVAQFNYIVNTGSNPIAVPPGAFSLVYPASAGSHTFSVKTAYTNGGPRANVYYVVLVAYEL